MTRKKTAAFLVDCLSNMPDQTEQVQSVVDTAIAGLKRIANGGEWPEDEALAAITAAAAAWGTAQVSWASDRAVTYAADWAALKADAAWSEWAAKASVAAADWAARAHADPAAERARQATKRKELGL